MGLDEAFQPVGNRPSFDPELPARLRAELERHLEPLVEAGGYTDRAPLVITKFQLTQVLRCERAYCTGLDDQFQWSIPKAKGTILHKVLQASVAPRAAAITSPVLVGQAIDRLAKDPDSSISGWLNELTEFELAELQVEVTDLFVKFRSDFPPLQLGWRPRAESRARAELCDSRCILVAKFDLALGSPNGMQARTIVTDFKTGGIRPEHHDDMRFYALIETLRAKVPPWRMALYYIDSGTWNHMDIDESILDISVRRTCDGATKMVELNTALREPGSCSHPCSFCEETASDR